MFAFLNDLSISPDGCHLPQNLDVIEQLINNFGELKNYGIGKIRVPQAFLKMPIAGSRPIEHYIQNDYGDKSRLILGFVANRMKVVDPKITEALNAAQQDVVIEVTIDENSSRLLTEAYVMNCPSVSMNTTNSHRQDFLNCSLNTLTDAGHILPTAIQISNIHDDNSVTNHRIFLSEWKQKIQYAKTKWNPQVEPIWNKYTPTALGKLGFPLSVAGKKEKIPELTEVGFIVAELNGWHYDECVTKKNKNSGQYRRIFRSKNADRVSYLSIDFEKPHGFFELYNYKGKHQKEIRFSDGLQSAASDNQGHHDIEV